MPVRRFNWLPPAIVLMLIFAAALVIGVGTVTRANDPSSPSRPLTDQEVGEYKAAHDPAPPPTPSQELLDQIAQKNRDVREWYLEHPDKIPDVDPPPWACDEMKGEDGTDIPPLPNCP